MTTVNDQQYINQIIEGNSKAFEVLVDRYKNFVFTLAHKMMKDLLFNKNKYDFEALGESVRNEFTLEAMTKKYLSLISR